MKKLFLGLGLICINNVGWGQINETILYYNNFNNMNDSTIVGGGYETGVFYNGSYDGSIAKTVGGDWVITDTININNLDEITVDLRVNRVFGSYNPFIVQYSPMGSDEWTTLYESYITTNYFEHLTLDINNVDFIQFQVRFKTITGWYNIGGGLNYGSPSQLHYIEDLTIKGPTPEPSLVCGLDTDNSGNINILDLMEFLMWYGYEVECN